MLINYQVQLSFLIQDYTGVCVNRIRTDFVRPCTDFTTWGPFVLSIDPVDSSMSSCDLCARNIDLWFNKSVYVTSFTSRRVRFMPRTVLSDLLEFLVLVFCPCKLQSLVLQNIQVEFHSSIVKNKLLPLPPPPLRNRGSLLMENGGYRELKFISLSPSAGRTPPLSALQTNLDTQ